MKTPISYYGGKQKMVRYIIKNIPEHNLYCEPFIGGGAVFFSKEKSNVEVINDTNKEVINFYRIVQMDFAALEKEIRISLHSRGQYNDALVIYNNSHMFSELRRAWAFFVLASQSFSSKLDGSWGYDISKPTTSLKVFNKQQAFSEDFAIRLQRVQIECADALRIINSRDSDNSFFYCDPPYFNSNCGHYNGYKLSDFRELLDLLSTIKGKFLLSSYPSEILAEFTNRFSWYQDNIEAKVSVSRVKVNQKKKIEVLTANYPISIQD